MGRDGCEGNACDNHSISNPDQIVVFWFNLDFDIVLPNII